MGIEIAGNVALPGQQELVEVLAEIRAWMPSLQPDMSLDNTKGKGTALSAWVLLVWGSAVSSFGTTHANECRHNQEGGRGFLLLMTTRQMDFILSSWSLGVVSHTFVTCRCGGCHGAWLRWLLLGRQVATPSTQFLKSGKELQVPGFLQEHGKLSCQPASQHSLWAGMSVSKPLRTSSGLSMVDAKKIHGSRPSSERDGYLLSPWPQG